MNRKQITTELETAELRRLVDEQCDAFEKAWTAGEQPAIGDFLDAVSEDWRPNLFRELLALELELTVSAAQPREASAYRSQFSGYAEIIERVFVEFHSWAQSKKRNPDR